MMTPGTEAPSEMNFLLPDHRALCTAENATHSLHNILTLRDALVRDARVWSRYLDEALRLFAAEAGERHRATLSHGAFTHHRLDDRRTVPADVSLTLVKGQLLALLAGAGPEDIEHTGDLGALRTLLAVLDRPDPDFTVVTP